MPYGRDACRSSSVIAKINTSRSEPSRSGRRSPVSANPQASEKPRARRFVSVTESTRRPHPRPRAQATTASTSARPASRTDAPRRARPRTPRPSPSRRRLPSDPDPPARPRFRPAIAPRPSLATRVRTARIPAVGRAERVAAVEQRPQPDLAERDPVVLDERFDADRARGDGRPPASRGPRRARDRSGRRRPARRWPLPPRAPRGARPPIVPSLERRDQSGEERVAASHGISTADVEHTFVERAVRRCQHHALRPPRDDAGMSVPTRHVADLGGGREGVVPACRRHAEELPRLRDVHLHDVRLRGQGEAKPLPFGIQRDPDAAAACFLDQVPIALVGRAPRQGARDREPAPAFPSHRGGVGELDPRGVRGDGTVLVELGESGGLTVGDRQRGPALPMGPDELALHAFGGEGFLQPPTRVSPEQRDHADVRTERPRRPCDVQPLAARDLHEAGRPVDVALDQSFDLEQPIDGRVRGETDDHRPTIDACPASFWSRATSRSSGSTPS